MRKVNALSLFLTSIFCVSCSTLQVTSPTSSSSPSASSSPIASDPLTSASPSMSPSPSNTSSPNPSSSASVNPVTSSCIDLTVGQVYDSTVFGKYCPPVAKVGTKWVYSTSAFGTNLDTALEVINIQGGIYTLRLTGPNIDKTIQSSNAGYQDAKSDAKYTYQGSEDVIVPSGSYSAAAKLTTSQTDSASGTKTNLTYWLAKNVGVVKVKSDTNTSFGNISAITDLKSFNP